MEISVGQCRGDVNVPSMLKSATLEELYSNSEDRIMMCLNLPLGAATILPTPRLM